MKFDKKMLTLYAITDRKCIGGRGLEYSVEQALSGGATIVQLRDKAADFDTLCREADSLLKICQKYNSPLIINDSIDAVLKTGADGVHLGQSDIPCTVARKILGRDKLIGVSCATAEEAAKAQTDGADYLGVGAVFPTATKHNTRPVTAERIREIRAAVTLPFVVIGGVNEQNISSLYGLGINGAAVVSAIAAKPDITAAARVMRLAAEKL